MADGHFYVFTILLMLLGSFTHVIKKVVEVRKVDGSFSLKTYLTMYPYKTYLIIISGALGYLGLLAAQELSLVNSFMMGFLANSIGGIEADEAKK